MEESLHDQLNSWLRDGVIAPVVSPWGSPHVPVAKKDSSSRGAVDYREQNKYTLSDAYQTPSLSQVVKSLAWSMVFSSLNAAQAFHNISIKDSIRDATTFICMYGLCRMPFSLKNTGAVYCCSVTEIMNRLGQDSVCHY